MSFSIIFSSDERSSGTLSDATFTLDRKLRLRKGWKIIPSCMLPSLDNVYQARGNNVMHLDLTNSGTMYSAIIPSGEYTRINLLLSAVKTAMNIEALAKGIAGSYTCTYDSIAKRVTISHSASNFSFKVIKDDLLNYLGYSVGVHNGAKTYTAQVSPNLYPDICVVNTSLTNIERGTSGFQSFDPRFQMESALFTVFVTDAGAKIFDETGIRERPIIDRDHDMSSIRIWLTDLKGVPLSIQNAFVVKLQFMDQANSVGQ